MHLLIENQSLVDFTNPVIDDSDRLKINLVKFSLIDVNWCQNAERLQTLHILLDIGLELLSLRRKNVRIDIQIYDVWRDLTVALNAVVGSR